MCHLETYMEYLKGVCVPTHTVFVNTPKLWVCPHPYLFHRGLNKAWVWSHPQCTACKETVLPRDKVWVTPHPGQTACKVFSPTVWVCSHPRRTARHSTTLLFIYFFIYQQKHTLFGEHMERSLIDNVMKFHWSGTKIEQVRNVDMKVQVISHQQCWAKVNCRIRN